jgi:hypothetical protein
MCLKTILLISASFTIVIATQQSAIEIPRKPIVGHREIPFINGKDDPNPIWVNVKWDDRSDAHYTKLRKERDQLFVQLRAIERPSRLVDQVKKSYILWYKDFENPERLFVACSDFVLARRAFPDFIKDKDYYLMSSNLDQGWSYIRKPPHSYEFVRRGFLFNAGDGDCHTYGDLPNRLLAKDPNDLDVALALVWEYRMNRLDDKFVKFMLDSLERFSKKTPWAAREEYAYGYALATVGIRKKSADFIRSGILKVENAIKMQVAGYPTKTMHEGLSYFKKELAKLK